MRNASRKLSAVVLTLWLVAGLAACGGGGDPAIKTVSAQARATTTAAPAGGGTTTKTVTVQAPATRTPAPAKSSSGRPLATSRDKGGTPNQHSPAAQCRQAGVRPEVHPGAFASCVRKRARGQHGESHNPAAQCRQAGVSPEVHPRAFGACVQKKATGQ